MLNTRVSLAHIDENSIGTRTNGDDYQQDNQ